MSLFHRRLLFGFFVLLFLTIVPIVLIYSTGNTINWRRLSLEKTGSILIDSKPNEATIFLNNKPINNSFTKFFSPNNQLTTKAKIKNLAPGEYNIRLEKLGYWPWEEKFRLNPNEAKNFDIIKLFKQSTPELIYEAKTQQLKISPNKEKIALIKNKTLTIINLKNKQNIELAIPLTTNNNLIWSKNSEKIIIDNLIINLNDKNIINLAEQSKKNIGLLRWSEDSTLVYFVSNKKIFRYSLINKNIIELPFNNQLANKDIIDYLLWGDKIYIIAQQNNLPIFLFGSLEKTLKNLTLPSGNYSFTLENSPKPMISDGEKLYIIDELLLFSQPRLLKVTDKFKLGHWQNNILTYVSGLEIRRWENENQEYLITRLGVNINDLWPIMSDNAIIIATPEEIKIQVNGLQPFTITLAKVKNTSLIMASNDNKIIYFYGEYDNKIGLFSLEF